MSCHNVRGEDGPCDCAGCRKVDDLLAEVKRLREALEAYDKLSLVIESAVRERRDRDGREEGNYELLLRVISQSRAALLGGGE